MKTITIIGAGMMGSALAFPARENGHEVRLVGTHLDREIIETSRKTQRHPKFNKDFPDGVKYYQIEEVDDAINGSDMIIGGVSSFGVDWFADYVLPSNKCRVHIRAERYQYHSHTLTHHLFQSRRNISK